MVKTITTALAVVLLLLVGSIAECFFIKDTFKEVAVEADAAYLKILNEEADVKIQLVSFKLDILRDL